MKIDVYVHSSRDSMFEQGEKLGFTGEILSMFSYAASEVKLTMEVDETTGLATIVMVDDRQVLHKGWRIETM